MLVLGLHCKERKSTGDNVNTSNPNVNGGCPPLTANRISTDCVQISLGPSIQHIPLGVYHTEGSTLGVIYEITSFKSFCISSYKNEILSIQHTLVLDWDPESYMR